MRLTSSESGPGELLESQNENDLRQLVRANLLESGTTHLLLGFPKCATTSLAQWLSVGPYVGVSNPKETFLLCREHRKPGAIAQEGSLGRCFVENQKQRFRLEASTRNVYSDVLLEELLDMSKIKVILIFRDPVDAVTSWHNQLVQGDEAFDASFATCWAQSKVERLGEDLASEELNLIQNYCAVYRFGYWIQKWVKALGQSRVLVINMSELGNEDGSLQKRLDAFFGVELGLPSTPPVLNSYANIRFEGFYKGFKNSLFNRSLRDLERRFPLLSSIRRSAKEKLFRKKIAKPVVEVPKSELISYFAEDTALADRLYFENVRYWNSTLLETSASAN